MIKNERITTLADNGENVQVVEEKSYADIFTVLADISKLCIDNTVRVGKCAVVTLACSPYRGTHTKIEEDVTIGDIRESRVSLV